MARNAAAAAPTALRPWWRRGGRRSRGGPGWRRALGPLTAAVAPAVAVAVPTPVTVPAAAGVGSVLAGGGGRGDRRVRGHAGCAEPTCQPPLPCAAWLCHAPPWAPVAARQPPASPDAEAAPTAAATPTPAPLAPMSSATAQIPLRRFINRAKIFEPVARLFLGSRRWTLRSSYSRAPHNRSLLDKCRIGCARPNVRFCMSFRAANRRGRGKSSARKEACHAQEFGVKGRAQPNAARLVRPQTLTLSW